MNNPLQRLAYSKSFLKTATAKLVYALGSIATTASASTQQLYWTQGNANPSGPCSGPPATGAVQRINTEDPACKR